MSDDNSIPLKKCRKCGVEKPHTLEYFLRDGSVKSTGLTATCIECIREKNRAYRKQYPERNQAAQRKYKAKIKALRPPQEPKPRMTEEEKKEKRRLYRQAHREERIEACRRWREANPEKQRQSAKNWRKNNPEAAKNAADSWKKRNPERHRQNDSIRHHRRFARLRGLPVNFTNLDWQRAKDYFNGCCAACGRQLRDLFGTHYPAKDHWIPLSHPDCPGTISTNIIPLCHGIGGCNNSKKGNLPEVWLVERFGVRKGTQILTRIKTYFQWVIDNPIED
jgi:hypothetical protein